MKHYLLGILIGFTNIAFSQDPHPFFRNYTVSDGIPSSEVYQVKQARNGFVWFATGNGISRFNGYEFENYSVKDGLPDNTVFELCEDEKGRMWFVTMSCKIGYYFNGKIHPFKYNGKLQKRLKSSNKTTFYVDKSGTVHLGVQDDGVYSINSKGKIIHHPLKKGSLKIYQKEKHLAFSSNIFFFGERIRLFTKKQTLNWFVPKKQMESIAPRNIISLHNGNKLLSVGNDVIVLKKGGKFETLHFQGPVTCLYEDKDQEIWIGTYQEGIYRFTNGIKSKPERFLKGNSITSIFQDHEGGFWFTTYGNGVFYSPTKKILNYDSGCGLMGNNITQIATNGKQLFVASKNGYIHTLTGKNISIFNGNFLPGSTNELANIRFIPQLNELWVYGHLNTFRFGDNRVKNDYCTTFNDLYYDPKGVVWLTRMNCITKYNTRTNEISELFPNDKHVWINAIEKSPFADELYIGAIDGLWKIDPNTDKSTYLGKASPLLQNRIMDLAFLPNNWLVAATKGLGIIFYKNGKVIQISEKDGLTGDNVYKLFIKGSTLLAATDKGLSVISIKNNNPKTYALRRLTVSDGLASNELRDVTVVGNQIYVASPEGVSFFNFNYSNQRSSPIQVELSELKINQQTVPLKKAYHLDHSRNNLEVRFTGITFRNSGKTRYRYKMRGLSETWLYTDNRELQFTTLPPNDYTLILSAQNDQGCWGPSIRYQFYITAPFWTTWWFIALVLLFGIAVSTFIVRYWFSLQRKKQIRENELNKQLTSLKLKALRAQMNPHFTFNVINSIQHYILHADVESAYRYLTTFSRLIRLILSNSEKEYIPVGEELKSLELYLELETMRFEKRFDYSIKVDPNIDIGKIEIPSMLIQPFIENSIKHGILPSDKKGNIIIHLSRIDKHLKCSITDNGIGRAAAALNKNEGHTSFGSRLTHERLQVINSLYQYTVSETITDLYDENGSPSGTKVELFIPIP